MENLHFLLIYFHLTIFQFDFLSVLSSSSRRLHLYWCVGGANERDFQFSLKSLQRYWKEILKIFPSRETRRSCVKLLTYNQCADHASNPFLKKYVGSRQNHDQVIISAATAGHKNIYVVHLAGRKLVVIVKYFSKIYDVVRGKKESSAPVISALIIQMKRRLMYSEAETLSTDRNQSNHLLSSLALRLFSLLLLMNVCHECE